MALWAFVVVCSLNSIAHATSAIYTLTGATVVGYGGTTGTGSISGTITIDEAAGLFAGGVFYLSTAEAVSDRFTFSAFGGGTDSTGAYKDSYGFDSQGLGIGNLTIAVPSAHGIFTLVPSAFDYHDGRNYITVGGTLTPLPTTATTPELSSLTLCGTGVVSLAAAFRRRFHV